MEQVSTHGICSPEKSNTQSRDIIDMDKVHNGCNLHLYGQYRKGRHDRKEEHGPPIPKELLHCGRGGRGWVSLLGLKSSSGPTGVQVEGAKLY